MLSVIVPAHNEEAYLGLCLSALLASRPVGGEAEVPVEIVVAANACTDRTVEIAQAHAPAIRARGWTLHVLDLEQGGKPNALNAAEEIVQGSIRAYVDADVAVEPALLDQAWRALRTGAPRYASGRMRVAPAATFATRAYREIYTRVPFMTRTVPGAGFFCVNASGRARWGRFPEITADDLFVRLNFTRDERILLESGFRWELTEGLAALVRVRRRQDRGNRELAERFPDLAANEDNPGFARGELAALARRYPVGFAVYATVLLLARARRGSEVRGWARGRD